MHVLLETSHQKVPMLEHLSGSAAIPVAISKGTGNIQSEPRPSGPRPSSRAVRRTQVREHPPARMERPRRTTALWS